MLVSMGGSRKTKKWKPEEMTFSELAEKVSHPTITSETFEAYQKMDKASQDDLKDVGGFVLGEFKDGKRSNQSLISRSGIALDLDSIGSQEELRKIIDKLESLAFKFCLYSTRNSSKTNPRIRILFELKRNVNSDEYEYLSRKLCESLGMQYCDKTTVEPARLMYWPSVSSDAINGFIFHKNLENKPLDPDEFLSQQKDWQDISTWPLFPCEGIGEKKTLNPNVNQDPREKKGIIGLFNRAYSIPEAIETFLPDIYEPSDDPNRYSLIGGSSTKGGVVYGREEYGADVFFYSFHSTDPYGQKLYSAFDLVRVFKFGDSNQTKSTKEMIEFANNDPKVKEERRNEVLEKILEAENEEETSKPSIDTKEAYDKLTSKLKLDSYGKVEKTFKNFQTIIREDPKLKDGFHYDLFAISPMVDKVLPWPEDYSQLPRIWTKTDESGLEAYIETRYGIYEPQKTTKARDLISKERMRHPVREYLDSLEWDGIERLDTLLIDYFGAEDNAYTRAVIRKALIAAVARVMEPGIKFDTMPILIGPQGIGKSTFLDILGKDWFCDSIIDFASKEGYQMLHGSWIIEIGELSGFYKKEVEQIKAFLSKRKDKFRAPFDPNTNEHPRQCIIFGTTNAKKFLKDQTGNRRFWPVQLAVHTPTKDVFTDLPEEVDQIWAEAYISYMMGEDLFLAGEVNKMAQQEQELRIEDSFYKEEIVEFLLKRVPQDWKNKTLEERRIYWSNEEIRKKEYGTEDLVKRDRVRAKEIWTELFGNDISRINPREEKAIRDVLNNLPGLEYNPGIRFGKPHNNNNPTGGFYINDQFYQEFES